jgi:thioredoxin 1
MNPTHSHCDLGSLDGTDFDSQVLHSEGAVLVAFWAPWSKPCQVMDPVLLEVAGACAGRVRVIRINADDNPDLSLRFGIQHVPTLLYFEAGRRRGHLVGTASTEAILNLLSLPEKAGEATPSEGGAV